MIIQKIPCVMKNLIAISMNMVFYLALHVWLLAFEAFAFAWRQLAINPCLATKRSIPSTSVQTLPFWNLSK